LIPGDVDRVTARPGNVENNPVGSGRIVRVSDCLVKRSTSGVVRIGDNKIRGQNIDCCGKEQGDWENYFQAKILPDGQRM
jgi:hypothetical protein